MRSVERAVARLGCQQARGTGSVRTHRRPGIREGVHNGAAYGEGHEVVPDPGKSELRLKIFATVLGVDHSETLVGVPATAVPLVAIPILEIALFKLSP